MLQAGTNIPVFPKAHLWKNDYHSLEHVLIGLVVFHVVNKEDIKLFFSFKNIPEKEQTNLYYFSGKDAHIRGIKVLGSSKSPEIKKQVVSFRILSRELRLIDNRGFRSYPF